jgi:hypothetical protein
MSAPGTTVPFLSRTVPETDPDPVCANASAENNARLIDTRDRRRTAHIILVLIAGKFIVSP